MALASIESTTCFSCVGTSGVFVLISLGKYRGGSYQGFVKNLLDTVVSGVEMWFS